MALKEYLGATGLTDILTKLKTWITTQLSGKMNTDGSNADSHVIFDGAFTVGSRKTGSTVGTNSLAQGTENIASGICSNSKGSIGNETISDVTSGVYPYSNISETSTMISLYTIAVNSLSKFEKRRIEITAKNRTRAGYVLSIRRLSVYTQQRYLITIKLESAFGVNITTSDSITRVHYAPANIAFGNYSCADGLENSAYYDYSHAEGMYTVTGRENQHVQGKYNVGRSDTLFEIGNGTSNDDRRNIFEVYTNGAVALNNSKPDTYTFHITNTAASTAVAFCNKIAVFNAPSRAVAGSAFKFTITIKIGDTLSALAFDNDFTITSVSLFDKATSKQVIASANFTYTATIDTNKNVVLTFTVASAFVTSAVETTLNAVIDSASPGFSCIYAANNLNLTGAINGKGIVEQIPGLSPWLNSPPLNHITQHVGDFYLPTGGPRWNLEIEVDPGTAYYAICYLENTSTGAYFNHSICYAGVPVPTIAAPTVAPAPVAGKVIAFVGTTWTPFVAGVAGVVTDGVVTTKPRLRIQGYHANNTPTAGLGMHMRLFRIY